MNFSSDEYELDTTHIEYYHSIFKNCGMAGMYIPLPYVKKNKINERNSLGDSFNSDITITSTSSLNEIVAAKHLSRISLESSNAQLSPSTLSRSTLSNRIISSPRSYSSSTLSHRSSRSSESSVHSVETVPLN